MANVSQQLQTLSRNGATLLLDMCLFEFNSNPPFSSFVPEETYLLKSPLCSLAAHFVETKPRQARCGAVKSKARSRGKRTSESSDDSLWVQDCSLFILLVFKIIG